LKGRHRSHCLCFQGCRKFKPGEPGNCPAAEANYALCVKYDLTAPVFECPEFDPEDAGSEDSAKGQPKATR